MKKIILASQSPRRKELMQLLHLEYEVIPSGCDENIKCDSPEELVKQLSSLKANDVLETNKLKDCLVIGADTIVVCEGRVLGKPKTEDEAFEMLSLLTGNKHIVFTGVTIIDADTKKSVSFAEETEVFMYDVTDKEIWDYIATKDPMDKAGGYGVQSKGAFLVKGVNGDFYNVVGLPVARLYQELKQF